jgi:hypothetical protein
MSNILGSITAKAIKAARILDKNGKKTSEYLIFRRLSESEWGVGIYKTWADEHYQRETFNTYEEAHLRYQKRARIDLEFTKYFHRRDNGNCGSIFTVYEDALASYINHVCAKGESIANFERDYRGSYSSIADFVHLQLTLLLENTALSQTGIQPYHFNKDAIILEWFHTAEAKYIGVSGIKPGYSGKIDFHIFEYVPPPKASTN